MKCMNRDPVHYESKTMFECSRCYAVDEDVDLLRREHVSCHAPMLEKKPGWYFWDETWSYRYGFFPTEEKAREAFDNYAKGLNGSSGIEQ